MLGTAPYLSLSILLSVCSVEEGKVRLDLPLFLSLRLSAHSLKENYFLYIVWIRQLQFVLG